MARLIVGSRSFSANAGKATTLTRRKSPELASATRGSSFIAQHTLVRGDTVNGSRYLRSTWIGSPEMMAFSVLVEARYEDGCSLATTSVLPGKSARVNRLRSR